MIWVIFAIIGAFVDAAYFVLIKKLLKNVDQYVLAGGTFFCSFVLLSLISLIKGVPEIGPGFYSAVLITGVLNVISTILCFEALKITDLSLAVPMLSFTPLFLIFTSFIFLKEFPTICGILGIFLIVVGSYVLNTTTDSKKLFDPFKQMFRDKGVFYMLIVAFLFSISANFDKLVVINSDPFFGSSMVYLLLAVSFLAISFKKSRNVNLTYKENFFSFFLIGLIIVIGTVAVNIALNMQIVSYVISLKMLSILFSVLLGGLIFKEDNIIKKSLGALIMLAGLILILLF